MGEPQEKPAGESEILFWTASLTLIGIGMAAVALPYFVKARSTSAANACINNLRIIDAAANQLALEKGKTNGEAIHYPSDLTPYVKLNSARKIPGCPAGGIYYITKVGEKPTCSLSNSPGHRLP